MANGSARRRCCARRRRIGADSADRHHQRSGVACVRAAVAAELDTSIDELVEDLATQPDTRRWDGGGLRVLGRLYVDVIMLTAAELLDAGGDPDAERRIIDETLVQLRIVSVGRLHRTAARGGARPNP